MAKKISIKKIKPHPRNKEIYTLSNLSALSKSIAEIGLLEPIVINQNNQIITNKTYDGKIYIADFFFTTCPGICPIMTDNMIKLQEKFINDDQVLLLSHTVTPEIDSVSVLKKYSMEKGVLDSKWNMVTGDKSQIYNLARKSYLVAEDIEGSNFYDMIHTENFVLVDSRRRIRGFYDGTDSESMNQLIEDVYILKKEF